MAEKEAPMPHTPPSILPASADSYGKPEQQSIPFLPTLPARNSRMAEEASRVAELQR